MYFKTRTTQKTTLVFFGWGGKSGSCRSTFGKNDFYKRYMNIGAIQVLHNTFFDDFRHPPVALLASKYI